MSFLCHIYDGFLLAKISLLRLSGDHYIYHKVFIKTYLRKIYLYICLLISIKKFLLKIIADA